MKKTVWTIVGTLAVVASAIIVIASFAMGGCDHMLETTTGGSCWMKCHWTFVAAGFTGIAAVASSVLAVLGKTAEGRRNAAVTTVVVARNRDLLHLGCGHRAVRQRRHALPSDRARRPHRGGRRHRMRHRAGRGGEPRKGERPQDEALRRRSRKDDSKRRPLLPAVFPKPKQHSKKDSRETTDCAQP